MLHLAPEVAEAVAAGEPVVALESTIVSHGLPRPDNLRIAREIEDAVREGGAVGSLERLAGVADQLEALTASAERIAGVSTSLERLADASGVLPELAGAAEQLTGMPDDMRALVTHLDKAASQLDILVNDATRLASIIERLDETITTLAATLGPLQGATERVGRIVDRLPDRRRSPLS